VLVSASTAMGLALVGCALSQSALRPKSETPSVGSGGQVIAAKRCRLDVVILTRPEGDAVLDRVLWQVADEQVLEPTRRRALEANGLRIGRVIGDLPPEVEALLTARPPDQPDVMTLVNPDGTESQVDPSHAPAREELTLLLSHPDGKSTGKAYRDAKAYLRLTATHGDGPDDVALRVAPEIHHGPRRQGFGMMPTGGMPTPREFRIVSGQAEETFGDLAATLELKPGQIAAIGVQPGRPGSLGDVLFRRPDGTSDRMLQSVVLVWASRAEGDSAALATSGDPPPLLVPIELDEVGGPGEPTAPRTGRDE
jgi:hypothetical protein